MASGEEQVERTAKEAEQSAQEAARSRPLRLAARAGLAANGLIHLLVAWLALRVASGAHEQADKAGAMQTIAAQAHGRILLWLVTGGFAAVVIWRLREALWGFRYVRERGERAKKRWFSVGQLVIFAVLALLTGRVAVGAGAGGGGRNLTAWLLRVPGGRWFLVPVGAGVLITGAVMAVRGWRRAFAEGMDLRAARPVARRAAEWTGVIGTVAKGVAVMIIGVLIGNAAITFQPSRAQGMDAALKTLAGQPFGPLLLIAVAAGLASYGVFCFFDARYHRV